MACDIHQEMPPEYLWTPQLPGEGAEGLCLYQSYRWCIREVGVSSHDFLVTIWEMKGSLHLLGNATCSHALNKMEVVGNRLARHEYIIKRHFSSQTVKTMTPRNGSVPWEPHPGRRKVRARKEGIFSLHGKEVCWQWAGSY